MPGLLELSELTLGDGLFLGETPEEDFSEQLPSVPGAGSASALNFLGEASEWGERGLLVAGEITEGEAGLLGADAWTDDPFVTDTDSCVSENVFLL